MKLILISFLSLSFFLSAIAETESTANTRPNVIVILADDLGYSDVGFNRGVDFPSELGEIPTPNIDALASNGIICSNAHVTHPFCGPSRASILTGMYPHKIGAQYNLPNDITMTLGIPEEETYFSTLMDETGYNTLAVGKWHLGFIDGKYQPLDRGFDEFFGFLGGGKNYFRSEYDATWYKYKSGSDEYDDEALYNEPKDNHTTNEYMDPLQRNRDYVDRKEFAEDDYLTDVLTDQTLDFIDRKSSDSDPFMVYLAYNAPHTPLQAPDAEIAAFKTAHPNFADNYRNSDYLLNSSQVTKYTDSTERQEKIDYFVDCRTTYATMVSNMDANIGRVVAKLNEKGILDNTLIVFFSDNGGYTYSKGAVNYPLDALKGSTDEGGHRVPFFVHWPDKIQTPAVYPYQVSSLDVYPTLVSVAGGTIPATKTIDGKDILDDIIAGDNARENEALFVMRPQNGFHNAAIVSYPYRISKKGGSGSWKLFDVRVNPEQQITESSLTGVDAIVDDLEDLGGQWATSFKDVKPAWFDNEDDGTGHPHRIHWFGENLVGETGTMVFPDYSRVFGTTITPTVVAVDSVVLSPSLLQLEVGQTFSLTKNTYPTNASNKEATYTSSNNLIATVSDRLVTAVDTGRVTITVTSDDGGHQAFCNVTVVEVGGDTGGGDTGGGDTGGGNTGDFVSADTIPGGRLFEFEGRYTWTKQADCLIDLSSTMGYDVSSNSVKMAYDVQPSAQKHLSVETGTLTGITAGEFDITMQVYKASNTQTEEVYLMVIGGTDAAKQLKIDISALPEEQWSQVTAEYTATKDFDDSGYVRFRTKSNPAQGIGTVYIDNLSIMPKGTNTSFSDVKIELECHVAPNPVRGILTISAPKADLVNVYNVMGIKVNAYAKTEDPLMVDMSGYASGTYLLQITSDQQQTIRKVIVE